MDHLLILLLLLVGTVETAVADQNRVLQLGGLTSGNEAIAVIDYQLDCTDLSVTRERSIAMGTVLVDGREQRFELFSGAHRLEIVLGYPADTTDLPLTVIENSRCSLSQFNVALEYRSTSTASSATLESLVFRHSPFIAVRPDQVGNRETDLPLVMAYHSRPTPTGGLSITYTAFFSDEDSVTNTAATNAQMARYGRRTDIEWVYEVELDPNNAVVNRWFQSSLHAMGYRSGIGHERVPFTGSYLPGTSHPVLYNAQTNNVFSQFPLEGSLTDHLIGHHLMPSHEVLSPAAREAVMLIEPWTYQVSDEELHFEGKLARPSTEYLIIELRGSPTRPQAFVVNLWDVAVVNRLSSSGGGSGDIDRFGEDMWAQESHSGLPLSPRRLNALESGTLHARLDFESTGWMGEEAHISRARAYRLVRINGSYSVRELTNRMGCVLGSLSSTHCNF